MVSSQRSTQKIDGRNIVSFFDAVNDQEPSVLFLHGGAPHASPYYNYLVEFFNDMGQSCLRFDHFSWGESIGERESTSLQHRIEEARFFGQKIKRQNEKSVLIASSMGGHVALEILPDLKPTHLILFCPAAYASKAVDVNFGDGFKTALQEKNSFEKTHVFDVLKSYDGAVLHIIGSDDVLIPPKVTGLYANSVANSRHNEFCVIEKAPHNLQNWFSTQPDQKEWLFEKLKVFLDQ